MKLSPSEAWAASERLGTRLAQAGHARAGLKNMPVEQLITLAEATSDEAAWLRALPVCPLHLLGTADEPMQHYALTRANIALHMAAYRPLGGARAGAGRPRGSTNLDALQQARLAHWLAWWPTRPAPQLSAYALADLLDEPKSTVRAVVNGTRNPSPALLDNLERVTRQLGFTPLPA